MPEQKSSRRARKDVSDTFGIRGAGASWQADFGMTLNEADLLFAVRREPVANRMVFKVAHDIFDKGFVIEEVAEKPNPDWSREVSKVLDGLNAKAMLTQMVVYERLFGWAILAMTYVDYGKDLSAPVQGGKEIRELLPYCSLQCNIQSSEEDKDLKSDRYGLPVFYSINRSGVGQVKLHFTRAIHCATRLLDHPYKGMSVLEPVYDDLTVWRNERWGLGQTLFRYGSGFPDIEIKGANKAKLDAFENSQQFKNLNARTHFMHDEKTVLEFKGLAGKSLNPEPYCTPIIESLSCGSGIPTPILRGAQAGALTGSEVNEREYFGFISDQQTLYEPAIWELIDRLMATGQISKVEDYRVVWPSGLELSEKDAAAVELQLAQGRNLKTGWMTIDEIRAEEGLAALPNGAGAVVLGVKKAEQQPFGSLQERVRKRLRRRMRAVLKGLFHGYGGKKMTRTFRTDRIEFDSAKKITETDTEIIVPTIFTRESILPFEDGRGYRSADQLKKYGWTLEGAWLVAYDHIQTVFPTDPDQVRGRAKNVKFCSTINGLIGDSCFSKLLCDQPFQESLRKGELKDVSVGYFSEDVMVPGKFGDEHYDFAQTKFFFGHLAAGVAEGRCPSPFCGMTVDQLYRKAAIFPMVEIQGMDSKQLEEIMGKDAFKNMQSRAVFFPAISHGDPEVTEKYVRIRVRDPNLFVDGSFRTIVLSAKEGIHAIIGKLKSDPKGATVVQNYMFEVAKEWTMEKAQAWAKQHKDQAPPAENLTEQELRTKIEDLLNQRNAIIDKLYPRPPQVPKDEEARLRLDLTLLDGEINVLTDVLAEKLAGVSGPNVGPGSTGPGADAQWTTVYVNNLPDDCFAVVESGGKKDDQGKTVPRSLRHLEYKNAQGEIDHDHLVAALQVLGGSHIGSPPSYAGEAKPKLCAAVKVWNNAHPDAKIASSVCGTDSVDTVNAVDARAGCRECMDPAVEVARSHKLLSSR